METERRPGEKRRGPARENGRIRVMNFGSPIYLNLLWLVPIIIGLLLFARSRRRAAAYRFLDATMTERLMPTFRDNHPWIKGTCLVLGLVFLIIAAARPRFGYRLEEMEQRGADVFVLLDVSRSMLANDVTPSRLERAKSDIRDLLTKLRGDRVGLIAFAGRPAIKVPLTTDQGYINSALDEIDTNSVGSGGSLIGDAIRKGLEAMPERSNRDQVLVLITDGDDQESEPLEAAKSAAARGVKIITIGLGDTNEGSRIPVDDEGNPTYLMHEGKLVWSKMDEGLLKQIALTTGGAYVPAKTSAYDLGKIYDDYLAGLTRGVSDRSEQKKLIEQYQIFLVAGLALLLIDSMLAPYSEKAARRGVTV